MSMDFQEELIANINNDRVEEVEFEKLEQDDLYRIKAYMKDGTVFSFVDVIFWGNNVTDYYDTLDYWTGGVSYSFLNFDPEIEIERKKEKVGNFYGDY